MERDSKQLDVRANKSAGKYMGEFAHLTVLLGVLIATIYMTTPLLVATGTITTAVGFLVMSFMTYAIYTVMHDAVHGSIQGNHRSRRWINEALGYLAGQVLMISFTAHRQIHLAHHRKTNDALEDPDFFYHDLGRSPLHLLYLSAISIFKQYAYYFNHFWRKAPMSKNVKVVVEFFLAIGWRVAFMAQGYWLEGLILFVGAGIIGNAMTVYFFAYLVHRPHKVTGRWVDTSTFVFRGRSGALIDWLWGFQNYHSIHHLFPRVPFYRYRELFDEIEPVMIAKGSPINYVGNYVGAVAERASVTR